jgi:transcriptional regulator with PAS, ATPase and Fis domain
MPRHDPAVGVAVRAAGAALELALRARAFAASGAGGLPVLERLVRRCGCAALLVEAGGAVTVANDAARAALGAEPPLTSERVFGLPFGELAQRAAAGQRAAFVTRAAEFDVELEPVAGAGGRALAVLVYLAPRAPRPAPRAPRPAPGAAEPHPAFGRVLGDDPGLARAKALAARFAPTPLPVLLLAETGTGKELFARAIHDASGRAGGPFVALNCGALSATLLESELFGHAPGAFTGASRRGADGKLGAADGGTLFLDEVAEMPPALQAALLRVLDDGSYYRVGDARPRRVDFRLLCATCRDLPALVERGAFRRDLFYRLHGARVTLPPLRERADRARLARDLLARAAAERGAPGGAPALADDAVAWIEAHDWPGNVRELKQALAHAAALAGAGPVRREHFPVPLGAPRAAPDGREGGDDDGAGGATTATREAILRRAVADAVRDAGGNVSEAARRLGVARSTVYRALGKRG